MPGKQQKTDKDTARQKTNLQYLAQYAGLGAQLFAAIGLFLYLGIKADAWLKIDFPLFSWLLPLLVIIGMIIKLLKETGKK